VVHPLYDYGLPVNVVGSGTPAVTAGEVEDAGGGAVPHTPPANTAIVTVPGGSPSEELTTMYTPVLTSINPDTAVVGGANLTMTATGSNFYGPANPSVASKILFNGGEEPTTYVSATSLTTGVEPSTAGAAATVPVEVSNLGFKSASRPFTFTDVEE
jgi:hypothetical protein